MSIFYYIICIIINIKNRSFSPSYILNYSILEFSILIPCIIFTMWGAYVCNIQNMYYIRGPGLADMPFHLNIIYSFAQGINYNRKSLFDVWSCFQSGIKLAYPMLHNFYVAVLIDCDDISLGNALQYTAMALSFSVVVLIHHISYLFTNDRVIAAISIPTWMLVAGIGWTTVFKLTLKYDKVTNWVGQFGYIDALWLQPLIHVFLPQRSATFAIPMSFSCLVCFIQLSRDFHISYFILAGLCTGFLPQLQVHSFVAVAQFAVIIALCFIDTQGSFKKYFWHWALYGAISCIIGLPLTLPYWERNQDSDEVLIFRWLWEHEEYGQGRFKLISVWWRGLGPFGYVMILFGWVTANDWQIKFWLASMFVWFTTSFIRYQPWAMDNLKLIFSVWLPIAVPYVTQYYVQIWKKTKSKIIKSIVLTLMVQATISSIFCFSVELFRKLIFVRNVEYDCGYWVAENTQINQSFLSFQSRFNPAAAFAGRQLYQGFLLWLGQHGLQNSNKTITKLEKLLQNKYNVSLYLHENVHYVLLREDTDFGFPLNNYNTVWHTVFNYGPYKILRLHPELETNSSIQALVEGKKQKRKSKKITYLEDQDQFGSHVDSSELKYF